MRKLIAVLMMAAAMTSTAQARETFPLEVTPPEYIATLKKRFPNLAEDTVSIMLSGGDCRKCSLIDFVDGTIRRYCDFTFGPLVKLGEPPPIQIKKCRKAFLHDVW